MFCLIARYSLDVGIEGFVKAGGGKLGLGEFLKALTVEVVLEML